MQHSCLSAHTDRIPVHHRVGNLFPGMKCDFVQVFGCAPGAWWDVAAFQALTSPSFPLQLHPSQQRPGVEPCRGLGRCFGKCRGPGMSRILPCTVQSLTYVQSCQSCSRGSPRAALASRNLPRSTLSKCWDRIAPKVRKRQRKREVEEGNVWKNMWVNK